MAKIRLEPGKRFRRDESFTEQVVDYYLEENDFTEDVGLVIATTEEPVLKIPLKYKDWVDYDGEKSPKFGSNAYRFFESLMNAGVMIDLDVETMDVKFDPDLRGQTVSFDVEHKSFASKTDTELVNVNGQLVKQPRIISFDVWTVASVGGSKATITEVKAPAPKVEEVPINEDDIKAGYIEALTPFGYEPFTLPNTIKVTNDYAKSIGSESIKAQYTVMKNKTKYLEALVLDGVLEKSPDGKYKFVDGVL
jgi:hypothetical protein